MTSCIKSGHLFYCYPTMTYRVSNITVSDSAHDVAPRVFKIHYKPSPSNHYSHHLLSTQVKAIINLIQLYQRQRKDGQGCFFKLWCVSLLLGNVRFLPLLHGNPTLDLTMLPRLCRLLPPVSVFLKRGCAADFWINVCLSILGWIPGVIHAW